MMIEKKDLLTSLQALLELEKELQVLCERQVGNTAFFSGIASQSRPEVRAEFAAFLDRSQQHRQAIENLMARILAGGRDVY